MSSAGQSKAISAHPALQLEAYMFHDSNDEDKVKKLDDFTRFIRIPKDVIRVPEDAALSDDGQVIKSLFLEQEKSGGDDYALGDVFTLRGGQEFRSLVCPCFNGEHYSLTLRKVKQMGADNPNSPRNQLTQPPPTQTYEVLNQDPSSQSCPSQYMAREKEPDRQYLFGLHEYVENLFEVIFGSAPAFEEQSGLVIVAGATSTGKSQVVRGLIHKYLCQVIERRKSASRAGTVLLPRRPHLVTFEDPIETLCYPDPYAAQDWGLDYTPRQKGADAGTLSDVLRDCLRQTPNVVYIGETRNLREWQKLVEFAGTGHLVFTTCHAGSLTELMGTLCSAVQANTAAKRSALASRLAAVVQLRRANLAVSNAGAFSKEATLPALLKRTPTGINAFTSNGLGALLPHSVPSSASLKHRKNGDHPLDMNQYCYGRSYFSRELLANKKNKERDDEISIWQQELTRKAIQFDLEGL